jgi:hypothetical protein
MENPGLNATAWFAIVPMLSKILPGIVGNAPSIATSSTASVRDNHANLEKRRLLYRHSDMNISV